MSILLRLELFNAFQRSAINLSTSPKFKHSDLLANICLTNEMKQIMIKV